MQNLIPLPNYAKRARKERTVTANVPRWLKPGTAGVYLIKAGERLKIGYSADIAFRVRELQIGCPSVISVVGAIVGADERVERDLHARFDEYRVHGEWFEYGARLADFVRLLRTNRAQGLHNSNVERA